VVVAAKEVATDGRLLNRALSEYGATCMQATPTTWRTLLEAGWSGGKGLQALCGGEALSVELGESLRSRESRVWNLYGPTETTIWSSVQALVVERGAAPIGRPIDNTQIYILDKRMEVAPIGVGGELYIGGDGVGRGYMNRADVTAERFVPSPYGVEVGKRIYRTGDLSRYREDGNIEYLGRIDHQVKIRGYRIELGEIESQLAQHRAVRECVVSAKEDERGDKRLVAYVVGSGEGMLLSGELRSYLQERLPDYMAPSLWVELERLPLTPNGKVDRKALPEPEVRASGEYRAPRTAREEILCELMAEALGVERVGLDDDFFALGGHSLLATQVMTRIQRVLKVELPLKAIFEARTVATLARQLQQSHSAALESDAEVLIGYEEGWI